MQKLGSSSNLLKNKKSLWRIIMEKRKGSAINFSTILSDGQNINQILKSIEIGHYEFEEMIKTYEKDKDRHGVIFFVRDTKTKESHKIIIDSIYGEANSTQIKDITYNSGADCDKRIILHTINHPDLIKGYTYDAEMAAGFAHINNDCNVKTYIVKASVDRNEPDSSVIYDVEVKPDGEKRTDYTKLPTKQEFEQAEFGIYYNYTIDWDIDYIDRPEDWINNYWYMELKEINFKYPVWNKDGLFMLGESKSELGVVTIKWLLDAKMELLKKVFDNSEINLQKKSPTSHVMSIKLWDRPLSDFVKATTEEKESLAVMIRRPDPFIFEFWQELFYKEKSDNEIIDYLGCLPKQAFTSFVK